MLYRLFNIDSVGTLYKGDPTSLDRAVCDMIWFRDMWPADEVWIEPAESFSEFQRVSAKAA